MLNFRFNFLKCINSAFTSAINRFQVFNEKISCYFEGLRYRHMCRVGGERYKIGEVWSESDLTWKVCGRGGRVDVFQPTFSLVDRCRGTLSYLYRTMTGLRNHGLDHDLTMI